MISLIDTTGTDCSKPMRSMFAARKAVFVDLLGWRLPVLDGQFELDQFDDANARYLIVTDRDHGHLASARLLSTIRPHILDSLFPALCAGPVPRGPDTFEITRFCLDRTLSAAGRRDARNRLVTALVEHALVNGIRTYTGVADSSWLAQILKFGWDAAPLGQFLPDDGKRLAALRIHITAATPALLEQTGMWSPIRPQRVDAAFA